MRFDIKIMNVLLTCAGRRHYLAMFFQKELGAQGKVVGTDMDISAPALQACDIKIKVSSVFADDYLKTLKEIIINEDINMVFSLNDLEIGLLASYRDDIENATGAILYVPTVKTLQICSDKWFTYRFANENNIKTPKTFLNLDDAQKALQGGEITFPLIIKPRWGSASIGLYRADTLGELREAFKLCYQTVINGMLAELGTESPVIIQELILGAEYGVDLLYGKNENFIGFTAKRKLAMRAGETDKAITVDRQPFETAVDKISSALPHRGNLDCDFLERDGELFLLELNPRFGGGYPFTHLAGANHIQMLLDDYLNQRISPYRYNIGQAFAKCDTLVPVPVS